ncbi:MAG TPA: hypothetical protein VFO66_09080, partial [Gemmatimonadaceae bacterium]|nr:hypothetical protein [Gemmatimonadaceae bacterium]
WYVKGLPGSADLRRQLHAVNSLGEVEGIFEKYLAQGIELSAVGDAAQSPEPTAESSVAA